MIGALLLAVTGALLGGGENRYWLVEVELRGACDAVRIDCGADGETRLEGPFAAGEDRRLVVPVPLRSPLGAAGLEALPLPRAEPIPPGSAAVRVLGFAPEQPAERLERALGPLLARPRPPAVRSQPRAGRAELLLVVFAGGALLRLRSRLVLAAALAAGTGTLVFLIARTRAPERQAEELIEWEAGSALALSVRTAPDELELPRARLEVEPGGLALALRVRGQAVLARARGARLAALESVAAPELARGRNDDGRLVAVWTRTARGEWRAHGPWEPGAALGPPAHAGDGPDGEAPPGWLAGALPPGRTVLVARAESGAWLRCVGFEVD